MGQGCVATGYAPMAVPMLPRRQAAAAATAAARTLSRGRGSRLCALGASPQEALASAQYRTPQHVAVAPAASPAAALPPRTAAAAVAAGAAAAGLPRRRPHPPRHRLDVPRLCRKTLAWPRGPAQAFRAPRLAQWLASASVAACVGCRGVQGTPPACAVGVEQLCTPLIRWGVSGCRLPRAARAVPARTACSGAASAWALLQPLSTQLTARATRTACW